MASKPSTKTKVKTKSKTKAQYIQHQRQFQRGIDAATALASNDPDALQKALVHLQAVSQADRVYLFENFTDSNGVLCTRQTNEACAPDVSPEIDNPDLQHIPYKDVIPTWPGIFSSGGHISALVSDLDDEVRFMLEAQGILAVLLLPIFADNQWYGIIGFDNTKSAALWEETSIELLDNMAELIGKYIGRVKHQTRLEERAMQTSMDMQQQAEQHHALLESMPDPVVIYNMSGLVEYLTPTFTDIFGWSFEDVCGKPIDFVPGHKKGEVPVLLDELNRSGTLTSHETERLTKDGTLLNISLSASLLRTAQRESIGSIVILRDITAKKKAEADLLEYRDSLEEMVDVRSREVKKSAERANALLNAIPDSIFQLDQNGVFIDYSADQDQSLDIEAEAFLGERISDVMPEQMATPAQKAIQQVLKTGDVQSFEYQIPINDELRSYEARFAASGPDTVIMLARDITEKQRVAKALADREQLLRLVFNTIPQSIFWKDLNSIFLGSNHAFAQMTGTTQTDIVGKTDYDLTWSKEVADSFVAADRRIIQSGVSELGVIEPQARVDGKEAWLETNKTPLRNAENEIIGILGIFQDITEKQGTQEQLQYQASLLENISDAIISSDPNFVIRTWNHAAEELYGYEAKEVIGRSIADFITTDYLEGTAQEVLTTLYQTGLYNGRARQQVANGRKKVVLVSLTLLKNLAGEPVGFVAVNRDVTELEQVEAERQRLTQIIENTSDLVALLDTNHNIFFLNQAGQEMVGYSYSPDSQLSIADIIPGNMVPVIFDKAIPQADDHGRWSGETNLQHRDGTEIPVSQVLTAHNDESGGLSYYAIVARDITEQRALAQQVENSLHRRSLQVSLTNTLAQQISAAVDLTEVYTQVIKLIKEEFDYYHIQLFQYNESTQNIIPTVGYGDIGEKVANLDTYISLDEGLIGLAGKTKETVLRPDVTQDPNWAPFDLLPDTKGEVVVPIIFQDQLLGILDVQSDQVNQLAEEDRVMLEGLCGQIAIAIENTRLRQDMEHRLEELNNLQRLMSREGWEIYGSKLKESQKGYLFDQNTLHPLSMAENGQSLEKGEERKAENENGAIPNLPLDASPASPLVVNPITVRGELIGSIGIQDLADQPLSTEEKLLLQEISQQVGEALETARLLEQTHKRAVELETVAQVSTTTATILQRDQLLQSVASLAKESFSLYHANIYLVEDGSEELRLTAGSGGIGELLIAEEWRIQKEEQALPAQVMKTGQGQINNDVFKDPTFIPNPFLPQTRSKLAVPMIAGGAVMGILELHADRPNNFTVEDLQIHSTLATQTAIALQNAELFQEQLETAEKLREVDRLKSEFLASMSHELRTPLNSIIGFADVLLEGIDGELNDRMREDILLIRDGGQHLRNLIGDILDMSKLEAGMMDLSYSRVDLNRIAQEVLAMISGYIQDKPVHLIDNIEEEIGYIQADRTRLVQILLNLLSNAVKFTDQGSITLTIKRQRNFDVIISVKDTGDGIKQDDVPLVFAQFRQVGGMQHRKAGGTGLGMPITKQLVELHGGEIWLESVYGMGTTFYFTIPHDPPEKQQDASQRYYA